MISIGRDMEIPDGDYSGGRRFSFIIDPSGYGYTIDAKMRRAFWRIWNKYSLPVFDVGERKVEAHQVRRSYDTEQ